jgi:hypothetical protein
MVQWNGGVGQSPYSSIVYYNYLSNNNHNKKMVHVSLKGRDLIFRSLRLY